MAFPAQLPGDPAAELRKLRRRLLRAAGRAVAAMRCGHVGDRPGDALRRFLLAEEEAAAIVRRIKALMR